MKLTFLLSSLWLSGGVRVVIEFANRLTLRGHSVALVYPGGTLDRDLASEISPQVKLIETPVKRASRMNLFQSLMLTWSMAQQTPASDIILPTHTPATPAGWIASRLMHKGECVWFYQDYIEMFQGKPLETWLVKNALRWQKGALVVSEYSKQELASFVQHKPVLVSSEGLSHAEYFHPIPTSERRPDGAEPRAILYLGDNRPRKGLYDFLEAAKIVYRQFPGIRLVIVSKEDCEIPSEIPSEFIYRPAREDLARLYATCAVFVLASWWESFGLPPLEAMACGAPVVMTDSRGVRDYAKPGVNCLMVEPHDVQTLADAILTVLRQPDLADRLRKNGPETASQFTWARAVEQFENGLLQITGKS